jgi:hypothetical protein
VLGAGRAVQWIYRRTFDRLRRAVGNLAHELPPQLELRRLAAPYFHSRLDGGEGDMLVGKTIWAHRRKKAHVICELSPYSCMPNTMSVGAMAGVLGRHPDILYAPLEIKGDAEVHALSRCQMIPRASASMDQPTYTPVQQIVERSGTLFFSFQDLDSTKPAGSVKIRVETIAHYLGRYAAGIIERKRIAMGPGCPLLGAPPATATLALGARP